MKLNTLTPAAGSTHSRRRIGRGPGSGLGGTSTRGHKGAKARSGYKKKIGFEGGQMPLYRRIPKRGFTNIWRKEYEIVNVETLNRFDNGTEVTPELLIAEGIVKQVKDGIKILGNGKLEKNLTVQAQKFTKSALEKIEAAGGKAQVI